MGLSALVLTQFPRHSVVFERRSILLVGADLPAAHFLRLVKLLRSYLRQHLHLVGITSLVGRLLWEGHSVQAVRAAHWDCFDRLFATETGPVALLSLIR